MTKRKSSETTNETLRALPSVADVLAHPSIAKRFDAVPRPLAMSAVKTAIDASRKALLAGVKKSADALLEEVASSAAAVLDAAAKPGPHPVINATGILVHTNLGRAPLAEEAIAHIVAVARGYSSLEYDLETGERGSRQSHVEPLLVEALGVEAAIAVNNNAAAVMLVLATVAQGKQVIVSRGELVEIGGSFRVPDILRASGATLVEVGTTNRTHEKDYLAAIGPETAAILKVHTSNFRVVGFTAEVAEARLAAIAREKKIPFVVDLGSGLLAEDVPAPGEPRVADVAKHADVVTFSGDKLLGGPQAGIIAGRRELLEKIRKHPLARAVRLDKLSLAALAATLRMTLAGKATPVIAMAREPIADVKARAERLARAIGAPRAGGEHSSERISVVPHAAAFGGGSVPGQSIPSFAVRIPVDSPDSLASALRASNPPVIVRVADEAVWMDCRTMRDDEVEVAAGAARKAMKS